MIAYQPYEKMQAVPDEFTPKELRPYPKDNETPFEEYFFNYYKYTTAVNKSDRLYLPIQWTAYYNNHKHGRDRKAMNRLQLFINSLDRNKKYFTVIQNDDGILNDVSSLDILKFGMGCKGHIQLPLVCQPHKYEFKETGRPIFASFIGSITHPIREQMVKELQGKEGYFISTEPTSLHSYCYIMSQSKYVLCPRGYGKTSFRIMEALQYGATPVYISDEHLFHSGCLLEPDFEKWVFRYGFENNDYTKLAKETFEKFYTYEAVANRIYENL